MKLTGNSGGCFVFGGPIAATVLIYPILSCFDADFLGLATHLVCPDLGKEILIHPSFWLLTCNCWSCYICGKVCN